MRIFFWLMLNICPESLVESHGGLNQSILSQPTHGGWQWLDPGKHYQSEKPWLNEVFVKDPVKRGRGLSGLSMFNRRRMKNNGIQQNLAKLTKIP